MESSSFVPYVLSPDSPSALWAKTLDDRRNGLIEDNEWDLALKAREKYLAQNNRRFGPARWHREVSFLNDQIKNYQQSGSAHVRNLRVASKILTLIATAAGVTPFVVSLFLSIPWWTYLVGIAGGFVFFGAITLCEGAALNKERAYHAQLHLRKELESGRVQDRVVLTGGDLPVQDPFIRSDYIPKHEEVLRFEHPKSNRAFVKVGEKYGLEAGIGELALSACQISQHKLFSHGKEDDASLPLFWHKSRHQRAFHKRTFDQEIPPTRWQKVKQLFGAKKPEPLTVTQLTSAFAQQTMAFVWNMTRSVPAAGWELTHSDPRVPPLYFDFSYPQIKGDLEQRFAHEEALLKEVQEKGTEVGKTFSFGSLNEQKRFIQQLLGEKIDPILKKGFVGRIELLHLEKDPVKSYELFESQWEEAEKVKSGSELEKSLGVAWQRYLKMYFLAKHYLPLFEEQRKAKINGTSINEIVDAFISQLQSFQWPKFISEEDKYGFLKEIDGIDAHLLAGISPNVMAEQFKQVLEEKIQFFRKNLAFATDLLQAHVEWWGFQAERVREAAYQQIEQTPKTWLNRCQKKLDALEERFKKLDHKIFTNEKLLELKSEFETFKKSLEENTEKKDQAALCELAKNFYEQKVRSFIFVSKFQEMEFSLSFGFKIRNLFSSKARLPSFSSITNRKVQVIDIRNKLDAKDKETQRSIYLHNFISWGGTTLGLVTMCVLTHVYVISSFSWQIPLIGIGISLVLQILLVCIRRWQGSLRQQRQAYRIAERAHHPVPVEEAFDIEKQHVTNFDLITSNLPGYNLDLARTVDVERRYCLDGRELSAGFFLKGGGHEKDIVHRPYNFKKKAILKPQQPRYKAKEGFTTSALYWKRKENTNPSQPVLDEQTQEQIDRKVEAHNAYVSLEKELLTSLKLPELSAELATLEKEKEQLEKERVQTRSNLEAYRKRLCPYLDMLNPMKGQLNWKELFEVADFILLPFETQFERDIVNSLTADVIDSYNVADKKMNALLLNVCQSISKYLEALATYKADGRLLEKEKAVIECQQKIQVQKDNLVEKYKNNRLVLDQQYLIVK